MPENRDSQFFWDQINTKRIVSELELPNETERFRLQLLQNKVSGAWLNVVPSPNIGTFLNNDVIPSCIGLHDRQIQTTRYGVGKSSGKKAHEIFENKIKLPFRCFCGRVAGSLVKRSNEIRQQSWFQHYSNHRWTESQILPIPKTIISHSTWQRTEHHRQHTEKRCDGWNLFTPVTLQLLFKFIFETIVKAM